MNLQRVSENYFLSLGLAVVCIVLPVLNWFSLSWAVLTVLRRNIYVGAATLSLICLICFSLINGLRLPSCLAEWFSLLVFVLPLWVMAYSLRLWRSLPLALELGFLVLLVMTVVSYLVYGQISPTELYTQLSSRLAINPEAGSVTPSIQEMYLEIMVMSLTVAWPAMLLFMQMSLLIFARFIQSHWYNPLGFQQEFHALRLSRWIGLPLLLGVILSLWDPSQMALQVISLTAILLSVGGLAFIHWFIKFRAIGKVWLWVIYAILLVFSAWALPLLVVIALLDSYLDLRQKLQSKMR